MEKDVAPAGSPGNIKVQPKREVPRAAHRTRLPYATIIELTAVHNESAITTLLSKGAAYRNREGKTVPFNELDCDVQVDYLTLVTRGEYQVEDFISSMPTGRWSDFEGLWEAPRKDEKDLAPFDATAGVDPQAADAFLMAPIREGWNAPPYPAGPHETIAVGSGGFQSTASHVRAMRHASKTKEKPSEALLRDLQHTSRSPLANLEHLGFKQSAFTETLLAHADLPFPDMLLERRRRRRPREEIAKGPSQDMNPFHEASARAIGFRRYFVRSTDQTSSRRKYVRLSDLELVRDQ